MRVHLLLRGQWHRDFVMQEIVGVYSSHEAALRALKSETDPRPYRQVKSFWDPNEYLDRWQPEDWQDDDDVYEIETMTVDD